MAPLTRWVEGMAMSSAPVAVARVTSVCPLSQCMLVFFGRLLRDLQPSMERATGRVQGGTRLARTHKDGRREVSERPPFSGFLFLAGIQVTAARASYAERTQHVRSTQLCLGLFPWRSLFLAVFTVDLAVSSRISSFPQTLGMPESRRQSPGWHSLDGVLPILFLALPLRVSLFRNCFVRPLFLGFPSP